MIKFLFKHFKVSKAAWILFFSAGIVNYTYACILTDTTAKPLLALVNNKDKAASVTIGDNVVFPEVLLGNEEKSVGYIEKFATNRRAYLIRTFNRGKKYFPKAKAVLAKYDLPHELKVLLALESAFNANAVSKAGAVGYWQIMDEVAKEYGLHYVPKNTATPKSKKIKKTSSKHPPLKLRPQRDDRKNFNKSTYTAARYLRDRSRNLNSNLLLMVASYNCGVGNVWQAMKKSGKDSPDFWDIKNYLPAETQTYVMNFIALNVIFHNYKKFENNSLLFKPVKINLQNTGGIITEDEPALAPQK